MVCSWLWFILFDRWFGFIVKWWVVFVIKKDKIVLVIIVIFILNNGTGIVISINQLASIDIQEGKNQIDWTVGWIH